MSKNMNYKFYFLANIILFLLLSSCNEEIDFKEIELSTTNIPSSAIADGKATYEIIAKVNPQVKDEFQTVTFKCSSGAFSGEGDKQSRPVRINTLGEAKISWIVPNKGGAYFVSASIGKDANVYKDEKKVDLKDAPLTSIKLTPNSSDLSSAVANGESKISLDIQLANNTTNEITLTTNEGSLSDGFLLEDKNIKIKADNTGKAKVQLKVSTSVKLYSIKAVLVGADDVSDMQTLTPKRAYADEIIIDADKLNPKIGSAVGLTIYLKRSVGRVSIGTPISIRAYQMIQGQEKTVGRFTGLTNAFTNENQSISLSFLTDTGDFDKNLTNPVIIEVKTDNEPGKVPSPKHLRIFLSE